MTPETHIIDMSKEDLNDLNEALLDEGYEIEFGHVMPEKPNESGFAYYICPLSLAGTSRVPISLFTQAKDCWHIARDLFEVINKERMQLNAEFDK